MRGGHVNLNARPSSQRRTTFAPLAAFVVAGLLGGCATSAPLPRAEPAPEAPVAAAPPTDSPSVRAERDLPKPTPATIVGSEESSALLDNFTAYLVALDDLALPAGRPGWAQPIELTAGPHRVAVGFIRGVFSATAPLEFTAEAGATYEIRQRNDAQIYGRTSSCEFWIVNQNTGERVTGVVKVPLVRTAR